MKKVTVFNLSGVYARQDFYHQIPHDFLDFTDLSGIHGFCDEEAAEEIQKRTRKVEGGIRFIDSGNFHYISFLLLKKLKQPFTLVVLDHHTDMMDSAFGGLLSCGSWIKRAIEESDSLLNVVLIGVNDELKETIDDAYKDRVIVYFKSQLAEEGWLSGLKEKLTQPVYLSVDKDVFSTAETLTDWDQGTMTSKQFFNIWKSIVEVTTVLAVDICGEYGSEKGGHEWAENPDRQNNQFNKMLLELLLE